MAILSFQKPDKVLMLHIDNYKGVFEFRPLEPGFGITVGNALRRILLSSLEGYAITSVKIEGVEHEFSAIDGVVQDVTDIILNLKQVRFKRQTSDVDEETARVVVGGQEAFSAGDINKFLNHFQVLNPDVVICNMDKSVKLVLEIKIRKGRGYVPAEENKDPNAPLGTIAIDSIHTPIRNVSYQVDNFRVEQKTDYEKLTITVETDGSIHPKDALRDAAHILIHHFVLFSDDKIILDPDVKEAAEEFDENTQQLRQLLKTKLVDLNLSVRALNCLKSADVETLGDLVSYTKADLLKFRNFGKKSLTELEQLVASKGLEFGMKVDKYKLDKD
ncbi:MAG: DNA-directed RNA polymerase subunit alpha [Bacteroidales bacterium]